MKIYEIPIYSMKKEIFDTKWERYIQKNVNKTSDNNKEHFEKWLRNNYVAQRQWKYNQIIGYLIISYKDGSIWFDEYLTLDKKIYIISKSKHFIQNMNLIGFHFYVKKSMSNDDIKNEIKKWILAYEKKMVNKQNYLDKKTFEKLLDFIDIKKLIEYYKSED